VFYLEGDIIGNIYLIIDKYIRRIKTKRKIILNNKYLIECK